MNYIDKLINDISEVEEGNKTAIELFKNTFKDVKDINDLFARIKELALEESSKYSNIELSQLGVEKRNGGVSGYDYSVNKEWVEINKKKIELENAMKTAAKTGNSQLIEETGELIEAALIKGYKKDSITLKH